MTAIQGKPVSTLRCVFWAWSLFIYPYAVLFLALQFGTYLSDINFVLLLIVSPTLIYVGGIYLDFVGLQKIRNKGYKDHPTLLPIL